MQEPEKEESTDMIAVICIVAVMGLAISTRIGWAIWTALFARIVVREFEVALLYRKGRFVGTLPPGLHWLFRPWASWQLVDRRLTLATVPGQEILTADNVGLKVSLVVMYEVEDPSRAVHTVDDYLGVLYAQAQLAVRDLVAARESEKLLSARAEMNAALLAAVAPAAAVMGLKVHRAEIKDLMFPGEVRTMFASVVRARQEGLASLEKARGETAAMRSLLNAATLMETHPALTRLKWIETFAQVGASGHNTFVVGVPGEILPWKEIVK